MADMVREMIDAHCRRGGKALMLNPSDRGEMIVVKHGPREMQLAWTHLLPATFTGRARMNVQNALAAAAAAFAAGRACRDHIREPNAVGRAPQSDELDECRRRSNARPVAPVENWATVVVSLCRVVGSG